MEVDETYMGGKCKNMPKAKRAALAKEGQGAVGKVAVASARDRATKRKALCGSPTTPAPNLGMTDFRHEAVNHSVGEYVQGMAHTNGVESLWAILKRGYQSTHHHMSRKHLDRYINEFAGRHDVRPRDTLDQMAGMARAMGRQAVVHYRDLVV